MRKIPCLFVRVFDADARFAVTPEIYPGCEWVTAGLGIATRKWDGTACMIRGGALFARFDAKRGKTPPPGWEPCGEPDSVTGHNPGWVPVGAQPQYQWIAAALRTHLEDGTYECCGPKIGANPERRSAHELRRHGDWTYPDAPRDFEGLKAYLAQLDAEGIVFHHPDGRMAKIRRHDFGFAWPLGEDS